MNRWERIPRGSGGTSFNKAIEIAAKQSRNKLPVAIWKRLLREVYGTQILQRHIVEGAQNLPEAGWGRIGWRDEIRERYVTLNMGHWGRMFVAWGRYAEDKKFYFRSWLTTLP